MSAALLRRPATAWLPWLCFGVAGVIVFPVGTILLLGMAIMASRYERAHGAWIAYLAGAVVVWAPLLISFRAGFSIWPYELTVLCAAGLCLLVVALRIAREHLGWWRALRAHRRAG